MSYTGLNNQIRIISAASANVDFDYGPYSSTTEALTTLTTPFRTLGKTVGVLADGTIEEYWFKSGTEDVDLVKKTNASTQDSSGGNAASVNYILDDSVVDLPSYFSSQYATEPIGTKVVDTVDFLIYEKVADSLWIKNLSVAVGMDIDNQATITGINLVSYK